MGVDRRGGDRPLTILQINTSDVGGGAEAVARSLLQAYRERGQDAWLAAGRKRSGDPRVIEIPNNKASRSPWTRLCWALHDRIERRSGGDPTATRIANLIRRLGRPDRFVEWLQGNEEFDFPGTRLLPGLVPRPPDILHGHNLHGFYFDLRELPALSHQVPTVITLHDMWLFTGHCAHSFSCERWGAGCGSCPDLTIYPAIPRDRTAQNHARKREIYARSRIHLAAPSRWIMEKAERSILSHGIVEAKVIPNGVDLSVFRPRDRRKARASLGLPTEGTILLCVGNRIRSNVWRDFESLRVAVARASERASGAPVMLLALGEEAPPERAGRAEIRFVPFRDDPALVAAHYQAADLYLHAAKADTFPTTVLEALACGVPVVGTAVGGIVEQVRPQATGLLVAPGDSTALGDAIVTLLGDADGRRRMGESAAEDARQRFGLDRQAEGYLDWYQTILGR